jgi:hypothetical protein
MRHNATEIGLAGSIVKRQGRRRGRGERLRAGAQTLAPKHPQDVDAVDEAFASFTRIDSPAAHPSEQAGADDGKFPAGLTDCLSAQLTALDRQRNELVQLLRRIDQASQSI